MQPESTKSIANAITLANKLTAQLILSASASNERSILDCMGINEELASFFACLSLGDLPIYNQPFAMFSPVFSQTELVWVNKAALENTLLKEYTNKFPNLVPVTDKRLAGLVNQANEGVMQAYTSIVDNDWTNPTLTLGLKSEFMNEINKVNKNALLIGTHQIGLPIMKLRITDLDIWQEIQKNGIRSSKVQAKILQLI